MIPSGWRFVSFAEIADYRPGRTPSRNRDEYWQGGAGVMPWVSIGDMKDFEIIERTKERITEKAFRDVFGGRAVPASTLLMSFKLTIGRVAVLGVNACHNEAIISIYPKDGIDSAFLSYALSQVDFDALQDRQVKGNTLNQDKINRIPLLLPPYEEQRQIASVLNVLREAIHIQAEALKNTQDLKRAVMNSLFSEGLRRERQKETEIGLAPESWVVEPLGYKNSVVTGGTPPRANPLFWEGGTIPWVKTTEVNYRPIDETEEHITEYGLQSCSARLLPPGTILLAMYGQGVTRGRVAVLNIEAACNQACAAIRSNDGAVSEKYLYHFLEYRYEDIRQLAHGGQQQNLNLEIVRGLPIAYPVDQEEQNEISDLLDGLNHKIDLHWQKRIVLDELFQALRRKLMLGEIRTADLNVAALAEQPSDVAA